MKINTTHITLTILACLPIITSCSDTALENEEYYENIGRKVVGATIFGAGSLITAGAIAGLESEFTSMQKEHPEATPLTIVKHLPLTIVWPCLEAIAGGLLAEVGIDCFFKKPTPKTHHKTDNSSLEKAANREHEPVARHYVPSRLFSGARPPKVEQLSECNHCNRQDHKNETILQYACGHKYHYTCIKKTERANTFVQCGDCHPAKHTTKKR